MATVELRARQRTFDGAYTRTAIGTLGYTIVVLKLFDERFYRSASLKLKYLIFVCLP